MKMKQLSASRSRSSVRQQTRAQDDYYLLPGIFALLRFQVQACGTCIILLLTEHLISLFAADPDGRSGRVIKREDES